MNPFPTPDSSLARYSSAGGSLSLGTEEGFDNIWSTCDASMGGLECDEILEEYEDPCLRTGGLGPYQMSPVLSPRLSPPKMSPSVVGTMAQSQRLRAPVTAPPASPPGGSQRMRLDVPVEGRTPPPTTTRRDALGRRCAGRPSRVLCGGVGNASCLVGFRASFFDA